MKTTLTKTSAIQSSGCRLDASYHASPGVQALHFLQQWANHATARHKPTSRVLREEPAEYRVGRRLDLLRDVCEPNGIFIPGRFKRIYVDDAVHGEPWLLPSDMQRADLNDLRYVSRKFTPALDILRIHKGYILLSRSGTIGNMAYVRQDMDGFIGSDDIIRIIADKTKIASGYLYAYLSSPLGRMLIEQKTYGAVIPHIEAHHVLDLPVPRLAADTEQHIHELIEQAAQLRVEAANEINRLTKCVNEELWNIPANYTSHCPFEWSYDARCVKLGNQQRLDAFYFAGHTAEYTPFLKKGPRLQEIASVKLPGKFKRMYVDSTGIPYLSGVDIYQMRVTPRLWLSRSQPELRDLVVQKHGTILVQADGQRYGLLGRPVYADHQILGAAVSNHLVRIVTRLSHHAGFIFLFLSTEAGRRAIVRESYGTSIPTIPVNAFQNLVISGIDDPRADRLGIEAVNALEKRIQANIFEDQAQAMLSKEIGFG